MKLSIIIPTAGRPVAIKNALHSILPHTADRSDVEVLVVDNNQNNALSQDLFTFCKALGDKVKYFREPSPGLGAARHTGYKQAKGDILTFIDDDIEVTDEWLDAILGGFRNPKVGLVGGPTIPKFTMTVPAWFWEFIEPSPYGGWLCGWLSLSDLQKDILDIDPNYIWGLNFSVRRDAMETCGGFHPDLVPTHLQRWQGDGETGLTMKLSRAGYRADYLRAATVLHLCAPDRLTPEYFKKRAFYQGVADSYTAIRAGREPDKNSHPFSLKHRIWRCLRHPLSERSKIKKMTNAAYLDGWKFHQSEVQNDPTLLVWVRRENYWNADIRGEPNYSKYKQVTQ